MLILQTLNLWLFQIRAVRSLNSPQQRPFTQLKLSIWSVKSDRKANCKWLNCPCEKITNTKTFMKTIYNLRTQIRLRVIQRTRDCPICTETLSLYEMYKHQENLSYDITFFPTENCAVPIISNLKTTHQCKKWLTST